MKKFFLLFALVNLCAGLAPAQTEGPGLGRMSGENVIGKVTAVAKDSITVAPSQGGNPVVVKIAEATRISKEREPIKVTEIKIGDTVFTRGKLDGNTMLADRVGVVTPEMAQRMQQGGFGGGFRGGEGGGFGPGGGQFKPEDWGKTFASGRIQSINETTLTITRQENPQAASETPQTLKIEVDENTSFRKGRESITLADIKPNDFVFARGEVKNGVFVSKELMVGGGRRNFARADSPADQNKPGSEPPAAPPKN